MNNITLKIGAVCSLIIAFALGGEEVQIVVLFAPNQDCEAIRVELNRAEQNKDVKSIDAVLKRKGVVELARFCQDTPWHAEPVVLSKGMGKLGSNASQRDLEVKLTMQGEKSGENGEESLSSYIELPVTRRSYRSFSSFGHSFELLRGRWQERAAWGDGKESLIVWQFVDSEGPVETGKTAIPPDAVRLEMLWMRASSQDLAQIEKAGPANKSKAAEWLRTRAKLWKGGSMMAKVGDKIDWHAADGTLTTVDGEEEANEIGIYIVGSITGSGEERELSFKAEFGAKERSKLFETMIQTKCVSNAWCFFKINGTESCNVLVYRVATE